MITGGSRNEYDEMSDSDALFFKERNGMVYGKNRFRWEVSNHRKKKSFLPGLVPEENVILVLRC